jgi:hypothetical protein
MTNSGILLAGARATLAVRVFSEQLWRKHRSRL